MVRQVIAVGFVCAATLVVFDVATVHAQLLGTFRWQTLPFCNVVSLTVVQQGNIFQLNGTDDLCGAGPAPVTGTATLTSSGVALGFTVALFDGRPVHISAGVSVSTLGGNWTDGEGNGGSFVFNPTSITGAPRPAPASRVLSATVGTSGNLIRGVGAVSATRTGFRYEVVFNRNISTCSVVASVGSTLNEFNVMYVSTSPDAANPRAIRVLGFTSAGSQTLVPFHLLVACP